MAQNSNIEWTHHTFNPWRGCTKVSPGCANCYAACNMSVKLHGVGWGPRSPRVVKAESGWAEPLAWDKAAAAAGERHRVFCASLADVFEGADTMPAESWPVVQAAHLRLLRLIYDTPHLDWLLLTKRPENIVPALHSAYQASMPGNSESSGLLYFSHWLGQWAEGKQAPANVWLGTSVENQQQADIRVPQLLAAPAAVRFLSCEPLLGLVDLRDIVVGAGHVYPLGTGAATGRIPGHPRINWVIVGGESGPKARPMHPEWARDLRIQCEDAGVPFLFKQWGEWASVYDRAEDVIPGNLLLDWDGKTVAAGTIPADRIWFEFGDGCEATVHTMKKVGKKETGRLLEGKEYNQFPTPAPTL